MPTAATTARRLSRRLTRPFSLSPSKRPSACTSSSPPAQARLMNPRSLYHRPLRSRRSSNRPVGASTSCTAPCLPCCPLRLRTAKTSHGQGARSTELWSVSGASGSSTFPHVLISSSQSRTDCACLQSRSRRRLSRNRWLCSRGQPSSLRLLPNSLQSFCTIFSRWFLNHRQRWPPLNLRTASSRRKATSGGTA